MKKSSRKPTNILKLSRKPSLKKSPVLAEAEKIVKEREKADKSAGKEASKTEKKPAKNKTAVKKPFVKKDKKNTANKGKKDPLWVNLAEALKRG